MRRCVEGEPTAKPQHKRLLGARGSDQLRVGAVSDGNASSGKRADRSLDMLDLIENPDGVIVPLKVVPGASRDRVVGEHGGALKVTVAAPPEKGKANKAIIKLLAKALGIRPNQIEVVKGATSADKAVLVRGIRAEAVRALAENV